MSRNLKTASKSAPTPGARLNKKRGIVSINSALQEEWNGRLFPALNLAAVEVAATSSATGVGNIAKRMKLSGSGYDVLDRSGNRVGRIEDPLFSRLYPLIERGMIQVAATWVARSQYLSPLDKDSGSYPKRRTIQGRQFEARVILNLGETFVNDVVVPFVHDRERPRGTSKSPTYHTTLKQLVLLEKASSSLLERFAQALVVDRRIKIPEQLEDALYFLDRLRDGGLDLLAEQPFSLWLSMVASGLTPPITSSELGMDFHERYAASRENPIDEMQLFRRDFSLYTQKEGLYRDIKWERPQTIILVANITSIQLEHYDARTYGRQLGLRVEKAGSVDNAIVKAHLHEKMVESLARQNPSASISTIRPGLDHFWKETQVSDEDLSRYRARVDETAFWSFEAIQIGPLEDVELINSLLG